MLAPSRVPQEAAGAFSHLQARVVPQLTTPRPEDLSQECTGMLAALCMAQVWPMHWLKNPGCLMNL